MASARTNNTLYLLVAAQFDQQGNDEVQSSGGTEEGRPTDPCGMSPMDRPSYRST